MNIATLKLRSGLYDAGVDGTAQKVKRATDQLPHVLKDLDLVIALFADVCKNR